MSETKPCPFCGSYATYATSLHRDGRYEVHIECQECGAMGPSVSMREHYGCRYPMESAAACALVLWNNRAVDGDE